MLDSKSADDCLQNSIWVSACGFEKLSLLKNSTLRTGRLLNTVLNGYVKGPIFRTVPATSGAYGESGALGGSSPCPFPSLLTSVAAAVCSYVDGGLKSCVHVHGSLVQSRSLEGSFASCLFCCTQKTQCIPYSISYSCTALHCPRSLVRIMKRAVFFAARGVLMISFRSDLSLLPLPSQVWTKNLYIQIASTYASLAYIEFRPLLHNILSLGHRACLEYLSDPQSCL